MDNFPKIRTYIAPHLYDNEDIFFDIEMIRLDGQCKSISFKTYYITSLDEYDMYEQEIKELCNHFNLRAMITVNAKSKNLLRKECLKTLIDYDDMNPWKVISIVSGNLVDNRHSVIAIDALGENFDYMTTVLESFDEDIIEEVVPSVYGFIHVIVKPFNIGLFESRIKDLVNDEDTVNDIMNCISDRYNYTLLYEH